MKNNKPRESKKSSKLAEGSPYLPICQRIIPAAIALATVALFLPALGNEFVDWDDYETLVGNPHFRGLGWRQLRWMFTTFHTGHYQPLSWVTFAVNYLLSGLEPFGYHLTNILLHGANAVLFYFVARRLLSLALSLPADGTDRRLAPAAALAALFFAIHPLRVESVAWATERRDVLSALFFLVTLYCYVRARGSSQGKSSRLWFTWSVVAYLLSLTAKAAAIMLPAVLLLLDVYPLRRLPGKVSTWLKSDKRKVLWGKLPFVVLAVCFAYTAVVAQQSAGALRPVQNYFISYRLGQAAYGIIFYFWKSFFPASLSPLYELSYDFDPWMPLFISCGIAAILISVGFYILRRRWPAPLACWVFYLLMIAPVLGFAQSGPQLVADRYSYLSCLSWALLAAGAFYRYASLGKARRSLAPVVGPVAGIVMMALAYLTWHQIGVWRDTKTLWLHVLKVTPNSSIAHYNLGKLHDNEGRVDEAVDLYRRALTINPAYTEAHYNLARLLAKQGLRDEAMNHYRQALTFKPNDADTHNNLGLLLAKRGDVPAALAAFQKAVELDPAHAKAYYNMGRVYADKGDFNNAVSHYRRALELQPGEAEIYFVLGAVLAQQGRLREAADHFLEAVKLRPDSADAHESLGRALAAQGKKEEAEKQYREALRILRARN